jgi:hypothetical protein
LLCSPPLAIVIDNSSAFRYKPSVPLCVPEINGSTIKGKKLIANPNCTTAIGLMAVNPLLKKFGMKKLIMSTYQASSGAGHGVGMGGQLRRMAGWEGLFLSFLSMIIWQPFPSLAMNHCACPCNARRVCIIHKLQLWDIYIIRTYQTI